jgi:hypothetical protein
MFDPERDHDPGVRAFYARLLAIAMVTAVACVALWPAVTGFSAGPDHDTGCVAIRDGWHSEVLAPSARELAAAWATMPPMPLPAQQQDPQFMDKWRAEWRAAQASPAVARANRRIDWLGGPGACVAESRHRLIVSGVGLGALLLLAIGFWLYLRVRTKPRRLRLAHVAA